MKLTGRTREFGRVELVGEIARAAAPKRYSNGEICDIHRAVENQVL